MKRLLVGLVVWGFLLIGTAHAKIVYGVAHGPEELLKVEMTIRVILQTQYNDLRQTMYGDLAFGVCGTNRNDIVYAYWIGNRPATTEVGATVREIQTNRCGDCSITHGRTFYINGQGRVQMGRY